ncbi:uncharacterized protein LOC6546217 [Drosophila erecta]|uniref:Uncharacterized protein n=1 Tax=Drosophila erecta TaxID=7220 RepID=B3NHS3_DROER|nr:uncharacterized protein LOC6546217 [Drosophila erecta]EDV51938.1 uncharacterized protein Dere_GG13629 [Drosophila erecta]
MAGISRSSQPRLQLYIPVFWGLMATVLASLPEEARGAAGGESRMDVLGLSPGQRVLAAVPASGRTNFLLYQLAAAINSAAGLESPTMQEVEVVDVVEHQEQFLLASPDPNWLAAMANEFQSVPVYETFPADLQHWLMDGYGISATDFYHGWSRAGFGRSRRSSSRTQLICTPDGQCYEVNKIVTACCPF